MYKTTSLQDWWL